MEKSYRDGLGSGGHCGSRLWSWRVNSSVLSRVVASHPEQSSVEAIEVVQERSATTSLRRSSPTPLGVVVCEASGVKRRSGNGNQLIVAELTLLLVAGCEDAGDVRCSMMGMTTRASVPPTVSSDECFCDWNPGPARSRSRILQPTIGATRVCSRK